MAYDVKVLLKVIAGRLSDYCEREGILPEKQCDFRLQRSTIDMMLVARLLQEQARKKDTPLFVCFIDLTKAYDSVERTRLWTVLAHVRVPSRMLGAIRRVHDGVRARAWLDASKCSNMFEVGKVFDRGIYSRRCCSECF